MAIRVGTAPDSWGVWFPNDEKQPPWARCLDDELEKRNLELVAGTVFGDYADNASIGKMCGTIEKIAELLLKFPSAKYIVMIQEMFTDEKTGGDTMPRTLSFERQELLYRNIQRTSEFVKKLGLVPALHPHVDCYIETEEQIENVLKNTDATLCFDTGHHAYSGGDPIAFYKKHHKRIPFLHIKECDMQIAGQARTKKWPFAKSVAAGAMREPGSGSIDFKDLFAFMGQISYDGWVVVEQDMYPLDDFGKPLEIAERTRKYLKSVGI